MSAVALEETMLLVGRSSEKNTTGAEDWTEVYDAIRWIQLIMALLSMLGSGSIVACVTSRRLSRTPELQPLLLLSVSDLLLALCWLLGAALFSQRCGGLSSHCYHLHTVEQVLYMASFFYTLNYVWNLYTGIREKFHRRIHQHAGQVPNRVSTTGKITATLSGLVPVLLMTPVFVQGNISQCQANSSQSYRCLLMHTGALYESAEQQQQERPTTACGLLRTVRLVVFLATFLLTLVGITVLMGKARLIYRRVVTSGGYLGNQQRASFRVLDLRMLLYPLVFIFCWGPAVGLALLRVAKPSACQGQAGVVLYILQAFTSASQGFLNCLVYGWTRAHLRRGGGAVSSRDADTQTPLLRAQKRRNYQAL